VTYDVMDVDVPAFASDFEAFRAVISELEHRLGALILQVQCMCTLTGWIGDAAAAVEAVGSGLTHSLTCMPSLWPGDPGV
jgi:hypothetical protein